MLNKLTGTPKMTQKDVADKDLTKTWFPLIHRVTVM